MSCFILYLSLPPFISVLEGVKAALTSAVSLRRNPNSAWGSLCYLCLVLLPALGAALLLLLNNQNGLRDPQTLPAENFKFSPCAVEHWKLLLL